MTIFEAINEKKYSPGIYCGNFDAIIKEHQSALRRFIYKKLWDKQLVDDIFQIVALEAMKSMHTYNQTAPAQYWLMGIARNVIGNFYSKTLISTQSLHECCETDIEYGLTIEIDEDTFDPHRNYEREFTQNSIDKFFKGLPLELQEVINEVIKNESNYENAAKTLNIAVGTVKSRVFRIKKLMKSNIELKNIL